MRHTDYKDIILSEFESRTSLNPSYSMRAYARDIDLSASQLNDILKGRKGLSSKKSLIVANKIGLEKEEILLFKALVEKEHGRSDRIKFLAQEYIEEVTHKNNYKGLSQDTFEIISDWYHFAILSAMELDSFDGTIAYLVKKLGIDFKSIEEAIKRMLREKMIDIRNNKFVITGEMYSTTHDVESKALKNSHKQTLKQALDCIDTVPVELRDISSITMAIDPDKIGEAKELLREFRHKISKLLESGKKTEVYNINLQLVPVSKVQ